MQETSLSTACTETFQLRPGVFSAKAASGELHLVRWQLWQHDELFGRPSESQLAALDLLAAGQCSLEDLRLVTDEIDPLLRMLHAGGWLTTTVHYASNPLYTVMPVDPPPAEQDLPTGEFVLSRFAVLHRQETDLVAESPTAWAQVRIHDHRLVSLLVGVRDDTLAWHALARAEHDLRATGLLVPPGDAETASATKRQWSTHELWFHQRSRQGNGGYFGAGYGRTQWAQGTFEVPPARHTPYPGPAIDLYRPDLDTLRQNDTTLTTALEDRRTVREHDDDNPMTADQLGELLYRCARIRGCFTENGIEYASRPLPAGGGVAELELYPVVRHVSGLESGMYHYDSHSHQLRLVRGPGPEVTRLLRTAAHTAVIRSRPQVLMVVSARFGRLMLTYEEMPYSIVLKHVGVLYQTMYLVATAMGLAPCGLGGGDTAAFTAATGLDPLEESTVGDFMLGSRPPGITAEHS
jgi:SagB-type dehydrogenase family enzyme